MGIKEIYEGAARLIEGFLRKELHDQGHTLTGALEESLSHETRQIAGGTDLNGFAADYSEFVRDGVPAQSASFKQFPFLVDYFRKRGLSDQEAKGAAAATIKKWQQEGMSTQASKRFSKTGARQEFVDAAFAGRGDQLDEYMSNTFDFAVDETFYKEKTETI